MEDEDTSLLMVNLDSSTFPKAPTSTCHLRVTSIAAPIQMPCQEVLLVSLPNLPHSANVSVKAVLGGSQGPW